MKIPFSKNKGNAILVSLGISSLAIIFTSGALNIINGSLRQSVGFVDSKKALYAAEGAIESALFDSSGRIPGYQMDFEENTQMNMQSLNNTSSSWKTVSREEMHRKRQEGNENDNTLFIPSRKATSSSVFSDPNKIISLEDNWKKVSFEEAYTFYLFVDESQKSFDSAIGYSVDSCLGFGGILGEQGICSNETKSIFGADGEGGPYIKNVFIDLYLPGQIDSTDQEENILLSWTIESTTNGSMSLPKVLQLQSIPRCKETDDDASVGSLCAKHVFSGSQQHVIRHQDKDGTWVRLMNPIGLMQGKDHVYPLGLRDFLQNDIVFRDGYFEKERIETPLFFPRLNIQMGKKQDWNMKTGETKNISHAYIRIGFEFDETFIESTGDADNDGIMDVFEQFSVPSERTVIQATGYGGQQKQKIEVRVEPKKTMPMFDYAVFQP